MDLKALQANYSPVNLAQPKKEVGGLRRFLAEAAPIVTGTLGAIGGSFLAPGLGTAAGGAAGAGLGSAIRSNLLGEELNPQNLLTDVAFGALPGAGKVLKGALGGAKAATQGKNFVEGFKAANAAPELTAGIAKPSMIQRAGQRLTEAGSGIKIGKEVGAINDTEAATDLFSKYGVVGTPRTQLKKINETMSSLGGQVDDILDKTPIKINGNQMAMNVMQAIKDPLKFAELDLTPDATMKALQSHIEKFGRTQTAKEFNDYIKTLNKIAVRAQDKLYRGVNLTNKETAALAAKKAGDEVLSQIEPIAPLKREMAMFFERNPEVTALANKKGSTQLLGTSVPLPRQSIAGVQSRVGALLNGKPRTTNPNQGALSLAFRPSNLLRQGAAQAVSQGVGDALNAEDTATSGVADTLPATLTPGGTDLDMLTPPATGDNTIWSDPQAVQQAYTKALLAGDKAAAAQILEGFKAFGQAAAKPIKKTETQRARDEAAQLTEKALSQLRAGNVKTGLIDAPLENFKSIFNAGDQATLDFNVTVDSLKAAIAKARAGTSFTPNEERLLNRYAPTAGDSNQQLMTKLTNLMQVYEQAKQREYGTQYTEPTAAAELGL